MLIYGNTPSDIRKMMWRRKYKFLAVAVVIFTAVTLMGCTVGSKRVNPPLMVLEKFWDTLGSGENKTKKDSTDVE